MNEQEKRNAIRTYFAAFPKWAVWCIIVGVICMLSGEAAGILAGVVLIAAGGAALYFRTQGISDAQFDEFRNEDLRNTASKALQKWGIDESEILGKPVFVFGPSFATIGVHGVKRGKDGVIRFNPIRFVVLGFGEHQMLAYGGVLDMVTGNVLKEETEEFFYRDVVSVSTKTDSATFMYKGQTHQINDTETFVLTTSGATSIRVPLRSPRWAGILGGGEMPTTHAEEAIAAVRAMLRQKKGGVPV